MKLFSNYKCYRLLHGCYYSACFLVIPVNGQTESSQIHSLLKHGYFLFLMLHKAWPEPGKRKPKLPLPVRY